MILKKFWISLLFFTVIAVGNAKAAGPLVVNGQTLGEEALAQVYQNTTYVSLRAVSQALRPEVDVSWNNGAAELTGNGIWLSAVPGLKYIEANGRMLYVKDGVRSDQGRTLLPIRILAEALGASVVWDPDTGTVWVTVGESDPPRGEYESSTLYWLSRIISAESRGESLEGKIAVANVILNRVESEQFPDSVYDVIFDGRWGGQFEPVRNGTIYQDPTQESILAAKLALEGANTAGDSLYFLAPKLTQNHWIMENRSLVQVIGSHWFYR